MPVACQEDDRRRRTPREHRAIRRREWSLVRLCSKLLTIDAAAAPCGRSEVRARRSRPTTVPRHARSSTPRHHRRISPSNGLGARPRSRRGARRLGDDGPTRPRSARGASGLIEKVHGGATRRRRHRARTNPVSQRSSDDSNVEKDAIAERALAFVQPELVDRADRRHDHLDVRRRLRRSRRTSRWSPMHHRSPNPCTRLPTPTSRWSSPVASARPPMRWSVRSPPSALAKLHIDALFMGVHGMDDGLGYSTPEPGRGRGQSTRSSHPPDASSYWPTTRNGATRGSGPDRSAACG